MKKRLVIILTLICVMLSQSVFCAAASNTQTVDDAGSYINGRLNGGYLDFDSVGIAYLLTGGALSALYYEPSVKYYRFIGDGVTVTADKNAFFDFNLQSARFELEKNAFNVTYTYNDGRRAALSQTRIPISYAVSGAAGELKAARFGGVFVPSFSKDGALCFETTLLGAFDTAPFEFSDVKNPAKWYYRYVNGAGALGIMNGMGDNMFKPEGGVSRAQLAAMIVKATQDDVSYRIDDSLSFTDVARGKWYYDYIMKCASLKIVEGIGGGRFDPEGFATREEIATVIARLIRLIGSFDGAPLPAIDKSGARTELSARYPDEGRIHDFSAESVLLCGYLGIMNGDSVGFRPRSGATRAECAKIFGIIYEKML